ncbi:hypothetical protein [Maritimibacter sp. UBA3975]|uniref:hypothetical protein n=1 Tax=Maritimibacter sp. UBA3975 TaxID=1946833 RepID=UPI000C0992EE|nr:hypothetical protein [Maritimibacter sp. UBA3975]MAM62147.1 hypothetical protein [Maritimibacter sp.]|tara:strand:+ start:28647 stop:29372 length:726 start_codon:yes stop_codon:yes gene_type:complete
MWERKIKAIISIIFFAAATQGCTQLAVIADEELDRQRTERTVFSTSRFASLAVEANEQYDTFKNTVPTNIPTTGSAEFTGFGLLDVKRLSTDATGDQLIGLASLGADFAPGGTTISGAIGDIYWLSGAQLADLQAEIASGDTAAITARLGKVFENLDVNTQRSYQIVVPQFAGSDFTAELSGSVNLEDQSSAVTLAGTAQGNLRGPNAESLGMFGDVNQTLLITQDGESREGTLSVFAKQP